MNRDTLFFPSLLELSADQGPIGQELRVIPQWAIQEADRTARENHEKDFLRQKPGRLFAPDPWQILIDARATSTRQKAIFRAAQSQIFAVRHVIGLLVGRATVKTDLYDEILRAEADGDKPRSEHLKSRLAQALLPYQQVQKYLREQADIQPELIEELLATRRTKLVHRGQRHRIQAKPFPKWNAARRQFPLETMLVEWWVSFETYGIPGLMFYRNAAVAKLLLSLSNKTAIRFGNLGRDHIKAIRQRLGLIPVGEKAHLVWDVTVMRQSQGWEIHGYTRDREKLFHGVLELRPA